MLCSCTLTALPAAILAVITIATKTYAGYLAAERAALPLAEVHLPQVGLPMLFVQGSSDTFGNEFLNIAERHFLN